MLAVQPVVMAPQAGALLWPDSADWGGLEPVQRCLSLNGAKDAVASRLASLHRVQLSASSDSALLDSSVRRAKVQPSSAHSSASAPLLLRPARPMAGASGSSQLFAQLQQIHTWDRFDVFRVAQLTQGRPLYTVAMAIFEALGLLNWKLDRRKVEAFLVAAEQAYGRDNPYHNSTHAADVVQATFIMLRSVQQPQFTKLEVFALLLSAIVHDIAHPGVTNDFLVKTEDPLAAAHGSTSVNELHHLAAAFSIMASEDTNLLAGLTAAEQQQVRDFMRSAVLCTDMAQHNQLAEQLQASCERHPFCGAPAGSPAGGAAPGSRRRPEPSAATASASTPSQQRQGSSAQPSAASSAQAASAALTPPSAADARATQAASHYSREDRALLLRALLHLADLSNPARPLPTGATWGCLVAKEFLAQGDRERRLGLPVTAACDRDTVVVSTSQLRFIDMFLRPLLQQMRGVLGEALRGHLLRRLADTEAHWRDHQARVAAGANPLGP